MSEEKPEAKMLTLPNDTKVLSKVSAIGEALEEMVIYNRGTPRRLVLKDKILALVTEVANEAYRAGVQSVVNLPRASLVDEDL